MRLVLTLRTRDHADLVDAHVAFHLNAGVDFVIANDHRSVDGTREALERYERAGLLRLIRRDDERLQRRVWVDEMARLAATEHGADWVIHSDADEFWWPRGGDLKDVLAAVPERFGVLHAAWRHFAPRPEDGSHFAERMTVRFAARGPWTGSEHPFTPNVNVAHRADPDASVVPGNHDVVTTRPLLRGWFPIEVLHFPLRSRAQAEAKFALLLPLMADGVDDLGAHADAAAESIAAGRFRDHYERYVVDEDALERGLRDRTVSIDTRLRDALRQLAGAPDRPLGPSPEYALGGFGSPRLGFPPAGVAEEAALADDVAALADPRERALRRVEGLEERLATLERGRRSRFRHA